MHFYNQNQRRIQRNSSGAMLREDTGEQVVDELVDLTAYLTECFLLLASISIRRERFQKNSPTA